jgi:hypothetical protein
MFLTNNKLFKFCFTTASEEKKMITLMKLNIYPKLNNKFYYVNLFDLQLPMQSVPITTDVVSSNLDPGEVYNIM